MKKIGKRLALCLLAFLLLWVQVAEPMSAAAETNQVSREERIQQAAEELYALGLIEGVGVNEDGSPNLNLNSTFTRGEGVAIIINMLGDKQKARNGSYPNPYQDDLGWAEPYVLFATANGIVSGTGDGCFHSGDAMDIRQFLLMVMRILGHWNSGYSWKDSPNYARARGVDVPADWNQFWNSKYTRGDAILACYTALDVLVGQSNALTTFRYTLEQKGVIPSDRLLQTAFTWGPLYPTCTEVSVSSLNQIHEKLFAAMRGLAAPITVRCAGASVQQIFDALAGGGFAVRSTSALGWSDHTEVHVDYLNQERVMAYLTGRSNVLEPDTKALMDAALQLHPTLVNPSMDEYTQVLIFHDYIVNNTRYDKNSRRVGTLIQDIGVCEDYAMTFQLLCWLSGIECLYVTGQADGGTGMGGHAWNKVKIDGKWYNIDVTFDDPNLATGDTLLHDFFLKSDVAFSKDHQIDANPFWPACPESWI